MRERRAAISQFWVWGFDASPEGHKYLHGRVGFYGGAYCYGLPSGGLARRSDGGGLEAPGLCNSTECRCMFFANLLF